MTKALPFFYYMMKFFGDIGRVEEGREGNHAQERLRSHASADPLR